MLLKFNYSYKFALILAGNIQWDKILLVPQNEKYYWCPKMKNIFLYTINMLNFQILQ